MAGVALGAAALFCAYLRMARTMSTNADGAANARQAWDLLHGNILLHGWTLSDVSFYTTELPQYAIIELIYGLRADVVHAAAAMTYTLLVLLAAAVAKGRTTGRAALIRVGVALGLLLVPGLGAGYSVVLMTPDHTGTSVPVLATWLLVDRCGDGDRAVRRWVPWMVAPMLTWAQIGDPLALFIGALPLVIVSAVRLYRQSGRDPRSWRGLDAHLLGAGLLSIALALAALATVGWAGGFGIHPPIARFSNLADLGKHLAITVDSLTVNFGAYLPDGPGPLGELAGAVHIVGLALALGAVGLAGWRLVTRRRNSPGDRVADVLAVAIVINLVAYIASTQPGNVGTARQIVAVLPLGAALAGRLVGGAAVFQLRLRLGLVVAVALAALGGPLLAQTFTARSAPAEADRVSQWLDGHQLRYGLGAYWASHNVTLSTGGRVQVAPTFGSDRIRGYRWESRADWYDPAKHDARFIVFDLRLPGYGIPAVARAQFGEPVEEHFFGDFAVFVYDHNLLVGLPAMCVPAVRPSMADCPSLVPGRPA
jgi:hypothetical protein